MTPEATQYIKDLFDRKNRAIRSMHYDHSIGSFSSVEVDGREITDSEHSKLVGFALNGSPEISIVVTDE